MSAALGMSTITVISGATVLVAALLTSLLAIANRPIAPLEIGELGLAMLWISICLNGVFFGALMILWLGLRRITGWDRGCWTAYLAGGLVSLHIAWALLNRLTLAQTWMRPPRFLTVPGLVLLAALVLMAICLTLGSIWMVHHRRRGQGMALIVAAALLGSGSLTWNARNEIADHIYSLDEIRNVAGGPAVTKNQGPKPAPVILLGLDGLSWSIMKPLMQAEQLPAFARLIQDGAIGYLDNGNDSYSPLIWNTIFTGRSNEDHGVLGFRKMSLPATGRGIPDLLIMPPSLHTFFGISHLLERFPSCGLWQVSSTGSLDRKAKAVWEVASDFERRVVVVNTLTSRPVQPVNGKMVVYQGDGGPSTTFPPNLAEEWRDYFTRAGGRPPNWRTLRSEPFRLIEKSSVETGFALELFSQEEFDLGVYFTSLVDVTSHLTWDFHSPNGGLITSFPDSLDNAEWEQLVVRHAQAPVFAAYRELDRAVGEFMDRYEANFLVVSDHGWTYSGFEHYGSQNGIVILSGPDFQTGVNLNEAHIKNIAPTILRLLEIPISRELIGEPLRAATLTARQSEYVASYGAPKKPRKGSRPAIDNEELQRLKNLGYIQ